MTPKEVKLVESALNKHGWVLAWRDTNGTLVCDGPIDSGGIASASAVVAEAAKKCKKVAMPDGSVIQICV